MLVDDNNDNDIYEEHLRRVVAEKRLPFHGAPFVAAPAFEAVIAELCTVESLRRFTFEEGQSVLGPAPIAAGAFCDVYEVPVGGAKVPERAFAVKVTQGAAATPLQGHHHWKQSQRHGGSSAGSSDTAEGTADPVTRCALPPVPVPVVPRVSSGHAAEVTRGQQTAGEPMGAAWWPPSSCVTSDGTATDGRASDTASISATKPSVRPLHNPKRRVHVVITDFGVSFHIQTATGAEGTIGSYTFVDHWAVAPPHRAGRPGSCPPGPG
jgi:hypothetical protein